MLWKKVKERIEHEYVAIIRASGADVTVRRAHRLTLMKHVDVVAARCPRRPREVERFLLHAFYASFLLSSFVFSSLRFAFPCLKHNFMNGRFPQTATELNGRRLRASNSCNYEDCKIEFDHPPELWILWRSLAEPMMGSSGRDFALTLRALEPNGKIKFMKRFYAVFLLSTISKKQTKWDKAKTTKFLWSLECLWWRWRRTIGDCCN